MDFGHNGSMKQNTAKVLVGLIIVFVGINLILKAAGIEFSFFFTGWWTLPIIIVAIVSMTSGGVGPWNFGLLLLGFWLLANQQDWIPQWFNSTYVVGAAIIGFGLLFIFNPRHQEDSQEREHVDPDRSSYRSEGRRESHESRGQSPYSTNSSSKRDNTDYPSYTAVFSGQEIRNSADNLDGSTLFALFGGLTVDFRDARIDHDIIVDASAVFGGIDIRFPSNVRVVTRATPLFGGVENKAKDPLDRSVPTVTVRCLAAFGGVDIK
ncbi:MAG: hypothetical protein A2Y31_12345 [Spirochaetes bacterium GWC2_52_13]|nr:MAG: hypothetical protein A2Y31_12345 [Spirochaetes bacterium GWC2_52_13]HCG62864.1 hypothetical protein [Sphaerochaeta sp.]